jgi:hypothetical protein
MQIKNITAAKMAAARGLPSGLNMCMRLFGGMWVASAKPVKPTVALRN